MAHTKKSLFAQLNALAEEINGDVVKAAAATKQAGPTPADPGGMQGATTHPTKDVDNNSRPATTGSRATEYEADVKDQQGALAVDNTKPGSQEGRQDEVQLNIGTTAKATGEDPSVEDDYKGDKDDPGTTHPAKANDGEKYSSVSLKEAREKCSHLGNDILAALITAADVSPEKKAEAAPKKDEPKPAGADKAAADAAYKAGYDLAAALGIEKDAAEAGVREVCANTLREADERANLVIGYLSEKAASDDPTDEAAEGESHGGEAGGSGASDAPPPGGGMDAMLGGDPAAAGADLGAAPPSEDEALQELAMALEELGISPEELLQMISGGAGGDPAAAGGIPPADPAMAGGAPPMDPAAAGGMPPMGPEKMAAAKQIAAAVKNFRLSGRFQVKEARTKRSRDLRDIMKAHVRELISR